MRRVKLNLNGDAGERLAQELANVHKLAHKLETALCELTINGRNYQTNEDSAGDLQEDQAERRAALEALDIIKSYCEESYENVDTQIAEQELAKGLTR